MTDGGRTRFDRALCLTTAAAYGVTLVAAATPAGAGLALATHALLMAPGIAVLRAVAPSSWLATSSRSRPIPRRSPR